MADEIEEEEREDLKKGCISCVFVCLCVSARARVCVCACEREREDSIRKQKIFDGCPQIIVPCICVYH